MKVRLKTPILDAVQFTADMNMGRAQPPAMARRWGRVDCPFYVVTASGNCGLQVGDWIITSLGSYTVLDAQGFANDYEVVS